MATSLPPPSPDSNAPASLFETLQLCWLELRGLARDHALLAVLEVHRAGLALAKILAAGVMIAVLVVTAWMGLVSSVVVWAVGSGASWWVALLVAALANIALAVLLGFWVKARVPELMLAGTIRQLRGETPED
jgi:hypothetical protein